MAADLSRAEWRRSTRSGTSGNCVEIADLGREVGVRDSKDPDGPALVFGQTAWVEFIGGVKRGRFDPR